MSEDNKKSPNENMSLSQHMAEIARKMHKENPRSKEFYSEMGKKSAEARRKKKELEI